VVGCVGAFLVLAVVTSYVSFNAFVRRGETAVPDLVGLSRDEAQEVLAAAQLKLAEGEPVTRFDAEVFPGDILEQSPKAGSPVKQGAEVAIVVSLGKQVAEVPNLRGHTLQSAEVNLRAAGLSAGRVEHIFSSSGQAERVVRQSPAAGAKVDHGRPVDLYLALERSPESFVMPDLVYQRYDGVRRFFEAKGFRLGSVKYEPYEGIAPGVVLRQFPLAGHRVARRDVISLVVASAQETGG